MPYSYGHLLSINITKYFCLPNFIPLSNIKQSILFVKAFETIRVLWLFELNAKSSLFSRLDKLKLNLNVHLRSENQETVKAEKERLITHETRIICW